jgi:hypothetical protein
MRKCPEAEMDEAKKTIAWKAEAHGKNLYAKNVNMGYLRKIWIWMRCVMAEGWYRRW